MLTVVVGAVEEGKTLESTVEEDIRAFETWFRAKGNDPLVRSEIAILKTYLYFKTHNEGDEGDGPETSRGDRVFEVPEGGDAAGGGAGDGSLSEPRVLGETPGR
jgi:hypothetical protein